MKRILLGTLLYRVTIYFMHTNFLNALISVVLSRLRATIIAQSFLMNATFLPLGAILTSTLLSACATRTISTELAQLGARQFGPQQQYLVFPVIIEDVKRAAETPRLTTRPQQDINPVAQNLASIFAQGQHQDIRVVVGGSSSPLTREIVNEALSLHRGNTLGGLLLAFVGKREDLEAIRPAADSLLVSLYFIPGDLSELAETEPNFAE